MNNIILIGLRGSGKTKIGKLLAEKLEKNFLDLDEEIEAAAGKKIKEIVEENGWDHFRKLEKVTIANLHCENTIIATGGGAILDPENVKKLKSLGKIIYLHCSPEICAERIKEDENRPSLGETMQELYEKRHPLYSDCADFTFERSDNLEEDAHQLSRHWLRNLRP